MRFVCHILTFSTLLRCFSTSFFQHLIRITDVTLPHLFFLLLLPFPILGSTGCCLKGIDKPKAVLCYISLIWLKMHKVFQVKSTRLEKISPLRILPIFKQTLKINILKIVTITMNYSKIIRRKIWNSIHDQRRRWKNGTIEKSFSKHVWYYV